jgi:hypothetical protein
MDIKDRYPNSSAPPSLPPLRGRANKSKGSRVPKPVILFGIGTTTIMLVGIGVLAMRRQPVTNPDTEAMSALSEARVRTGIARARHIDLLMVANNNPDTVTKAGLIQSAAIQRSNELRDYIGKLQSKVGSVYYNQDFDLIVAKLMFINNQKLLDAVNGKVNQVWLIKGEDGAIERQAPTPTQIIQQCLDADLALRMVTLKQINRFTEQDVNQLFVAQNQVLEAMMEEVQAGGNEEAIRRFKIFQSQQAARLATQGGSK